MNNRLSCRALSLKGGIGILAAAILAPAAQATTGVDGLTGPIQIATKTYNSGSGTLLGRATPAVADDGSFAAIWGTLPNDGSAQNLNLQRFDANGQRIGPLTQVNQVLATSGSLIKNSAQSVVTDGSGNVLVVWRQTSDALGLYGVMKARLFAADGTPRSDEFCVDPSCPATNSQPNAAVSMAADGRFVIAYLVPGTSGKGKTSVVFRRFNADGSAQDAQPVTVMANTTAGSTIVSMNHSDGSFVVTWNDWSQIGSSVAWVFQSVHARRYSATGQAQGLTINVASCTAFIALGVFKSGCVMNDPFMTMDAAGNLDFVWFQQSPATPPNFTSTTYLRHYNANGSANGTKEVLSTLDQTPLQVVEAGNGDFMIEWYGGMLQSYSAEGAPVGSPTTDPQLGELAADPAGRVIGASQSDIVNTDGSETLTDFVSAYSIP